MKLSQRDKEILDYIKNYMVENGVTPSMREVARGVGLYSTYSIHYHFQRLEELGELEKVGKKYRVKGMRYVEDGKVD